MDAVPGDAADKGWCAMTQDRRLADVVSLVIFQFLAASYMLDDARAIHWVAWLFMFSAFWDAVAVFLIIRRRMRDRQATPPAVVVK